MINKFKYIFIFIYLKGTAIVVDIDTDFAHGLMSQNSMLTRAAAGMPGAWSSSLGPHIRGRYSRNEDILYCFVGCSSRKLAQKQSNETRSSTQIGCEHS